MEMNRDLVPSAPKPADDDAGEVLCCTLPASSLQAAMSVRDGLRQKLDAAKSAFDELDIHRRDISFDAHTEGGAARKAFDKMNKDRLGYLATIETLETAVLESSRRVDEADRARRHWPRSMRLWRPSLRWQTAIFKGRGRREDHGL
jgi:hypothetical protein